MDPEKRSLFRNILANSKLGSKNLPAWRIQSLNNQTFNSPIQHSSSGDAGVGSSLMVPIIEIDVDYRTFTYPLDEEPPEEVLKNQNPLGKVIEYPGSQILIDDQKVLLSIVEENVNFDKENFDLEFYIVEEKPFEVERSGQIIREVDESLRRLEFAPVDKKYSDLPQYVDTYFQVEFDGVLSESELNDKGTDDILTPASQEMQNELYEDSNYVGNLYEDDADDEGC